MLQSGNYRVTVSNPTSPSKVILNERQNLENILVPNRPLLPELVNLEPIVQNLDQALDNVNINNEPDTRRRSARTERVDYYKMQNRYDEAEGI